MKYEFTGEERVIDDCIILRRIRRCIDGLVGGWIESESNLSQEGSCFVYDESAVLDYAVVRDSAEVRGDSVVCDFAIIRDEVKIKDSIVDESVVLSGKGCFLCGTITSSGGGERRRKVI
jgi:NDP-sugar pyrophosphorylase family protein